MFALYAFARITDDLGDCDHSTKDRTSWLNWWRETAKLNLENGHSGEVLLAAIDEDPAHWPVNALESAKQIFPAACDTVERYNIPPRYWLEIIDGVLADQQKTRFDTYEQMEHYCYLVASAVGLACLHIWEFEGALPMQAAVDCGLAFQMTNILRDIAEDAARGRIYLPRQHYERHSLCEDDLLSPRGDDRLCHLINEEIDRAKKLYDSGWRVFESLSSDGRPMFSMIWRTYRRLLDRIAEDPKAVVTKRIRLTTGERLGLVSQHFLSPMYRRLPVPPREVSQP